MTESEAVLQRVQSLALRRVRSFKWRGSVSAVLFLAACASAPTAVPDARSVTAAAPTQFPPGEGQPQVQESCGPCHAITVVTSARKSAAEWERTVNGMITRGARVRDDNYDAILDYLIRHFGNGA